MCFKKTRVQVKSLEKRIKEIISPYGYQLVVLTITNKKTYDIYLKLVCKDKINLKFQTFNNEIYLNNQLICDNSYHLEGFNDVPFKLLECLKIELKKNKYIQSILKNANVIFYSNKRETFPILNSKPEKNEAYRPHLIIKGTKEYLGVEFYRSQLKSFDKYGTANFILLYDVDYSCLTPGVKFDIVEGTNIVGEGEIID